MSLPQHEIDQLIERYAAARNRYRPQQLRLLLLAEAPPAALDRYFYFENVSRHDSLFLEVMGVLYPDDKKRYLASGREEVLKKELLHQFKSDGFWLHTLYQTPGLWPEENSNPVPALLSRLQKIITGTTPILLIGAPTFDAAYAPLREAGFNVLNNRLPFPGSGQQGVFRKKFSAVVENFL